MKKMLLGMFLSFALMGFSATTIADEVAEVYNCKLMDGKTIADAQAVNSKWLAWMRTNVSEAIRSTAATAIVGDANGFLYFVTYPDLATWTAGKTALDSDEGRKIESGFDDVMECSGNRLWRLQHAE